MSIIQSNPISSPTPLKNRRGRELVIYYAQPYIIVSVDSISRDGQDVTYMEYMTKTKISQKRFTFKTSNLHHCILRVILHLVHLPLHRHLHTELGSTKNCISQNNKQQRKLYSSYLSLLLTASVQVSELETLVSDCPTVALSENCPTSHPTLTLYHMQFVLL